MHRRRFVGLSSLAITGLATTSGWHLGRNGSSTREYFQALGPIHTFEPVVGDGKWIWREPPKSERGYLESRPYDVKVGIEFQGLDDGSEVIASTPIPMEYPEQQIEERSVETVGCQATLRELASGAGQLVASVSGLSSGQVATATATFRVNLFKQYQGLKQEMFGEKQTVPKEIRAVGLGDSPGIQCSASIVKSLAKEITSGINHPWAKAEAYVDWIRKKIRPRAGAYTSVQAAIQRQVGDCEEMSALFVALCRATNIPARLVWVPNHNWAEFYLTDRDGAGYWIPVHPACYNWFGWTGAHELVLQKGDRVLVPEHSSPMRLVLDWHRVSGRAKVAYTAQLRPLPVTPDADAGPGARTKDAQGDWKLTGNHPMDRHARR